MDIVLKNVQKKHLVLIKALAKALDIEVSKKEEKSFDSDKKAPDAKTNIRENEKTKIIIKEIEEQWE
jgi:hypothetical protein